MLYDFNAGEVFQIAIEIEKNGYIFYQKARDKISDLDVKELFEYLASEEIKHKEKFAFLKSQLPENAKESTVWDPENEINRYLKMMADTHIFRTTKEIEEKINQIKSVTDAINFAIQFEKDSIIFFLTMQDLTEEKKGKELIGQLIKEEQKHLEKLTKKLNDIKQ